MLDNQNSDSSHTESANSPFVRLFSWVFSGGFNTPLGLGCQLCGILCVLATVTHLSVVFSDWTNNGWSLVILSELLNGVFTGAAFLIWRFSFEQNDAQRSQISRWITTALLIMMCIRWGYGWNYLRADFLHVQLVSGLLYLPLLLATATLLSLSSTFVLVSILWMSVVPLVFSQVGLAAGSAISDWRIGPSIFTAYLVFYFFLRSITSIVTQNRSLSEEATLDPLTECFNRRGLLKAIANVPSENYSVLLLDIDHFKRINDTYGHDVGDIVISTVAQLIKGSVRRGDNVCRWGGEEFLVVLHTRVQDQVYNRAEAIRRRIERETWRHLGIGDFKATISIGICCHGKGLEEDLAEADKALYLAKKSGRNCVKVAGAVTQS